MIRLGFARRDITPDFPVPLAGYQKVRLSQGVHDRLYLRVLAFDGPVILVQADILEFGTVVMDRLKKGLAVLGIPGTALLAAATHTHSAFGGIFDTASGINRALVPLLGNHDPRLEDLLVNSALDAIQEALDNRIETRIRIKEGILEGLGSNRHDPAMPCDRSLFIMEFLRRDGKKLVLYNLSCHPTVLNGGNLLLSADFPGVTETVLQTGGYDMAVFVNGSAGDMSTRFTRRESSFDECKRFGGLAAGAVLDLAAPDSDGKDGFLPLDTVSLEYRRVFLKRAAVPPMVEAEANLARTQENLERIRRSGNLQDIRRAESFVEGAEISLLKARYAGNSREPVSLETGILGINGQKILCSPFELFSTLALVLKQQKPVKLFGYVNALYGYLGDQAAYDGLDYEALFSDFARGEGEHYIETALSLL